MKLRVTPLSGLYRSIFNVRSPGKNGSLHLGGKRIGQEAEGKTQTQMLDQVVLLGSGL